MSETQALQVDIFGETQPLESVPRLEVPKPRDASAWAQPRLFEPQMEGQLALESATPPGKGRRRGATTVENHRSGHDG